MRAVIGIGCNLGERARTVRSAIASLRELGQVIATSHVYESDAVGPPQPRYLNAATLVETDLAPRALLDRLLAIEARFGRVRRERWGARTLDLDLLFIEGVIVEETDLSVPHPRLRERPFALRPLLDVLADAVDPRDAVPLSTIPIDESSLDRVRDAAH